MLLCYNCDRVLVLYMELKIRQNKQEIILKTLILNNASDLAKVPIGHTWQCKPVRASLWKLILHAIIDRDWNPVHINPFTALLYKSDLGGLTLCGDLALSLTKACVHRFFRFVERAEVIASRYEEVDFKHPVRVGMRFYCRFILADRRVIRGKALCTWRFEALECKSDRLLFTGIWKSSFCPVEFSAIGKAVFQARQEMQMWGWYAPAASLVVLALVSVAVSMNWSPSWWTYNPANEYCWPIAP